MRNDLSDEVEVKVDSFKEVRVASKNCSHAWVFTLKTKTRPLVLRDVALMSGLEATGSAEVAVIGREFNLVSLAVKAIKSGKAIVSRSYTMKEVVKQQNNG